MLIPTALESVQEMPTLYLDPLPDYDENFLKSKWLYEGVNPLPPHAKSLEASLFLSCIIKKNEEIIIKDRQSGKVLVAVLRNRIGPNALQLMHETIIEIMKICRRVARAKGVSKYNQGSITAAGYLILNFVNFIENLY